MRECVQLLKLKQIAIYEEEKVGLKGKGLSQQALLEAAQIS